jgi:hypothetical protein
MVLGTRDPTPYVERMRRLSRSGYAVHHVALGPDRDAHRATATDAGLSGRTAALDPGWKEADALVVGG